MEPEDRVDNWVLDLCRTTFFFPQRHQGMKSQLTNDVIFGRDTTLW